MDRGLDEAPDWVHGDPVRLRLWRAAQPDVVAAEMPDGLAETLLPAEGRFRGGLLLRPRQQRDEALIVHFHGGGFFVGSPETHRVVGAWIAERQQRQVLLARYRLAPEHPVPAQAEDAAEALIWAGRQSGRLRLSGDSAGALVALWGFHAAPRSLRARIEAVQLFYGSFGQRVRTAGGPEDEALGLGPRSIAAMYQRLDPTGRIGRDPSLTPLAKGFSLPPAMRVIGAGDDPLLEHCQTFVEALGRRAGLVSLPGHGHGFLSVPRPSEAALDLLSTLA